MVLACSLGCMSRLILACHSESEVDALLVVRQTSAQHHVHVPAAGGTFRAVPNVHRPRTCLCITINIIHSLLQEVFEKRFGRFWVGFPPPFARDSSARPSDLPSALACLMAPRLRQKSMCSFSPALSVIRLFSQMGQSKLSYVVVGLGGWSAFDGRFG